MAEAKPEGLDILGIKALARTVEKIGSAAVDGAAAFLGRICLPAAEELGLLLQDKVRAWRAVNATKIANIASAVHATNAIPSEHTAHPRLVGEILERGSWSDDEGLQGMWAGLLAPPPHAALTRLRRLERRLR